MKTRLLILLSIAFIAFGCRKSHFDELTNGPEITIGAISLSADTKATSSPLPQGYSFRLYVLPSGVTDISKLVATRTYTISDAAGKPVLDAGQDPLTLSIDNFDTYIVGPLMGVDADNNPVEIASSGGVNCVIGNDIVSCHTPLTVVPGSNVLTPQPLNHRMAKTEFIVQRPTDAVYTDLVVNEMTLDAQPISGTFQFDANGISITPTASSAVTRVWVPSVATAADTPDQTKYMVTDYLFPQNSKELKITTTFDATQQGATKKYQQVGRITTDLAVGTQHRFTAEPITPIELRWHLKLVPWVDENMSGVEMSADLVFFFSGEDAPITIDGAQYWPDRSGNDRHAKIVNNIVHDPVDKCYRLKDGANPGTSGYSSYLELPKLGKMTDYTIELHYKSNSASHAMPIALGVGAINGDPREFAINLPWGGELSAMEGDIALDRRLYADPALLSDKALMESQTTWSFTRTPAVVRKVYRNGVEVGTKTTPPYDLNFDVRGQNTLFTKVNASERLYAVRMYRRVLTQSEIAKNAANDQALYSKSATSGDGYVESGMLLNLQGDQAPSTSLVSGKTVWPDLSIHKNHAVYTAASSSIVYNSMFKSYKFPNKANDLMKLLKPLGDLTNATIEVVLLAAGNNQNTVIYFANDNVGVGGNDNRRVAHMHYPYVSNIDVNFAYYNPGQARMSKAYSTFTYNDIYNQTLQYSIVRDAKTARTLSLYQNNIQQMSAAVSSTTISSVYEGYIGGQISNQMYEGYIMALRVYNRPLTEAERRINYEIDRQKYSLFQPVIADPVVGNFAGNLVSKQVGSETWFYFDKMLFAAPANESVTYAWQNTASTTTAKDIMYGKANTLALKNLGGTPAATACWNKSSTPVNQYYLPAQNQLMSMWIAKNNLGTFAADGYWSSTERYNNNYNAWFVNFDDGITDYYSKIDARYVRCVREHSNAHMPVNKVIKDASDKVYIDVQGMPSGTWSTAPLAGAHNEASAKNSVFKRIEIDKSDKAKVAWAAPGCSSGWRLPTQRELQLMYIMKDALVNAGVSTFAADRYWSGTESSDDSARALYVNFSDGYTYNYNKTLANNIRCIREVN